MLSFCQKAFLWHLHANAKCVYIMYAKYQMASVKALVQVDFPAYVLSEHKKPLLEAKCKKVH